MLYVVGIGPGGKETMTLAAQQALDESDIIVGYKTYIRLIEDLIKEKEVYQNGMHHEVERCRQAVQWANEGRDVALVCSGDAGVYGMAGLIYEIISKEYEENKINVEIIPGVTSANACAALLGAPLMHDYVTISLSDWLTDWELIKKRLHCAGQGDFVVALYNAKSVKRPTYIQTAQEILLQYKPADTPVGIVRKAYREGQEVVLTTLKEMLKFEINMLSTVIIGNSQTFIHAGKMITPRGYQL